jgi:hypothetical protein
MQRAQLLTRLLKENRRYLVSSANLISTHKPNDSSLEVLDCMRNKRRRKECQNKPEIQLLATYDKITHAMHARRES